MCKKDAKGEPFDLLKMKSKTDICTHRQQEHAEFESLQRNRVSNMSFAVCSAGEIVILVLMVAILKAINSDESVEKNTKAISIVIAFSGQAESIELV
jgi:hypothetical protein